MNPPDDKVVAIIEAEAPRPIQNESSLLLQTQILVARQHIGTDLLFSMPEYETKRAKALIISQRYGESAADRVSGLF
jgi:hypothetical protein